jgi:ABC-type multidrug transport system ATPase subunit
VLNSLIPNRYGGIPAEEFAKYAGETIYAPEEDVHFPTLTLKQMMTFALRTKTPGSLFREQSKRQFRQYVFEALTKMFGLVHQKYTVRKRGSGDREMISDIFIYYNSWLETNLLEDCLEENASVLQL